MFPKYFVCFTHCIALKLHVHTICEELLISKYFYAFQVEQYKRRVSRKKISVEAMLKTAMQSQLDGVCVGLNQLQTALQDIKEIRKKLVGETYLI